MTKKAVQFEKEGQYEDACLHYLLALDRKSTNSKAVAGLKHTGQIVLDTYLENYYELHHADRLKNAVYTFIEAVELYDLCAKFNVELSIPKYYYNYYESDLPIYLEQLYEEGSSLLDKEDFDNSILLFEEIYSLYPHYKDVSDLRSYARLEPLYRKGQRALDDQKFRQAYYQFHETKLYKDSKELKKHALKKAQYPIALLPFENATTTINAEKALQSQFLYQLNNNKNPFIKIIDRSHINTILHEQELSLSGLVDAHSAVEVGELLGTKALLVGRLVSLDIQKTPIKVERKKGWESYKLKTLNKETQVYKTTTEYKKVYYKEYHGYNSVKLTIEYKLISTETGAIIATNLFTSKHEDRVTYATYEGDKSKLYPGSWKSIDTPHASDDRNSRSKITTLLWASKKIKSVEELKTSAFTSVSKKAVSEINAYNPENE